MRQISQGGFTLLELTIVLVIVGLLAVGALKAASALRENAGISETSKRLNTLVMALQTFLMKNNRLPCPADPDIDTKFGDELCPSTPLSGAILRGVIPGRSLGLSSRLLDAWDRQFTYVVISEATRDNSFTSQRWPPTFKLSRPIDDQLRQLNQGNEGIVVIISHGANGSGAYLTDGQQADPQGEEAGQFEKKNIDTDSVFVQADYSTREKNPFDDQVLILTEDQIVQPLANQGALKTKQAQALEKLKRIENALIGFIVAHARDCPEKQIKIPSATDLSLEDDLIDPWGKKIKIDYPVTPAVNGCFPIEDITKITLKSRGLDRGWDNEGNVGKTNNTKNDINNYVIKSSSELRGILGRVGINPDNKQL
jgi:prepilin-type N-terminal cleavage/methylation domain-containing protein